MSYENRIKWIRSQLKAETELQIRDKSALRQPHDTVENAGWLQCTAASRQNEITALLIMLNGERNKVRPSSSQKAHSHQTKDKWAQMRVDSKIHRLTEQLNEAHPYPRIYVVVDCKLSPVQKGIQGAHAIAKMFKQRGVPDHSGFVFLEAENLYHQSGVLLHEGWRVTSFLEPYWKNKLTAIAVEPREWAPDNDTPTCLQDLPLAGSNDQNASSSPLKKLAGLVR